jgi:transcriptional regulator with XRE-family HTH domain
MHGMITPVLPTSEFQIDAGRRLRWLIAKLGLKQTQAADIMGVSKHVLRNWLVGDNPVQPYPLYRLCRSRGVDFNFVYLGDWTHLPYELAKAAEQEALANLAVSPAAASQANEIA